MTTTQARYLLGSASAALSLGESEEWERLTRTLYRRTGSPETFQQRCLAAVLDLGGDAVVSHQSALALFIGDDDVSSEPATALHGHGASAASTDAAPSAAAASTGAEKSAELVASMTSAALSPSAAIHISSTSTRRRRDALALVHRVAVLPDRWRTIHRGIPVAVPALVALQLFATESIAHATAAVDEFVGRGLTSGDDLALVVEQLGERGRSGTGALRTYLAAPRAHA